jgi:predicted RNA-binding protein with PUA-like domain
MADWLLKTEPSEYSFDDLVKEKRTVWTGVKNPVAVKHLHAMAKGDRVVVYHTGNEKAAVGLARVAGSGPDPADPKTPRVTIEAGTRLAAPVTLASIKKRPLFSDSPLVRIGRLSVVPLTVAQFEILAG